MLREALTETVKLNGMILWITIAAVLYATLLTGSGASKVIVSTVMALPLGRWGTLIIMQLILVFLGMFLDPMGMVLITIPIFMPIVHELGFDPVWFGVLFVMNMEMGYLTPPFGFNLFYMKAIVPKGITMVDIYRSIIPYVLLQALGLAIVMIFPKIALWIPSMMIRGGIK